LKSLEFFAFLRVFFSFADDEEEVVGQDEGNAFAVDTKLFLHVSKEVAKINVEDLTV
jgi:hypothetical protein